MQSFVPRSKILLNHRVTEYTEEKLSLGFYHGGTEDAEKEEIGFYRENR